MMQIDDKYSLWWLIPIVLLLYACEKQETTLPVRKNIEDAIFASGYMEQQNIYTVSARTDGIILSIPMKEGDLVNKKDLIAIIENEVQDNKVKDAEVVYRDALKSASPESPQLLHIQAQIDQARQQVEFDKDNFLRYEDLWRKKSVSKLDYEKAKLQHEAAQSNLTALQNNYEDLENNLKLSAERGLVQVNSQKLLLKDYQLRTEVNGMIINIFKKQGELTRKGEAIARIGSGKYIAKLFVSEDDIAKVKIRQPVAININTYPDLIFQAVVSKIYPSFDEEEQSYVIEAEFEEFPQKLFSGTQLQANIKIGSRKNILVIPSAFVVKGNFVTLQDGTIKHIETGSKNNVWTEVISGISEDEIIVKPKS